MTDYAHKAKDAFSFDVARDDELVLVDLLDAPIGSATKERTHREGLLHRAFSVVLWREGEADKEILVTRRAPGKYHSAGLWTNSCCSHPRKGEKLTDAVARRVKDELGCEFASLQKLGSFVYGAAFENDICEYEYDHVFLARICGELDVDPCEADAVRWMSAQEALADASEHPEKYCAWAPAVLSMALQQLMNTHDTVL